MKWKILYTEYTSMIVPHYYLQIRKSIRSLNLVIAHLKVLILKHILHMSCEENYTQL